MGAFEWGLILAGAGLLVAGVALMMRERGGKSSDAAAGRARNRISGSGPAWMTAGAVLVGIALL